MTPEDTVRRKVKLKGQAVKLFREEMRELLHLKNLLHLEKFLQSKITPDFDCNLSERLDAVRFLIESFESCARSHDLYGGEPLHSPGALSLQGGKNANGLDQTLSKTP